MTLFHSLSARIGTLLLSSMLAACSAQQATGDAAQDASPVIVTTAPATQRDFQPSLLAWGSVVADPQKSRAINVAYGGQAVSIEVVPGQSVQAGQTLLTIAPDPSNRAAYTQAETALTLARGELSRTQQLLQQGLATESQLAAAHKALTDAEAGSNAQRSMGGGSAQVRLTAPTNGTIASVTISNGDRFSANAPLLSFIPANALMAALSLPPSDAALSLQVGQTVRLQSTRNNTAVVGQIQTAASIIDPQTHLVSLLATLPASSPLRLGDTFDARVLGKAFTAWAVPRQALIHDDAGDHVFLLQSGKARRVPVQVLQPEGDPIGVEANLSNGARVIVVGAYELEDGMQVKEGQP